VGQRLIIPSHQIEADIKSVSGSNGDWMVVMDNFLVKPGTPNSYQLPDLSWAIHTLPVSVLGTTSAVGDVVCFVTDRCWYTVANNALSWHRLGDRVMVNDITNNTPFSTPTTPAGALYYRFVAAIDLSTSDLDYKNRGFKSANVLLNGQVPMRARLTTYQ
jgi:hypothetical protein